MSLVYCYSTNSKFISIEAMLYSHIDSHEFFPWKPITCAVEKKGFEWNIYYDNNSILKSQQLCKDLFNEKNFEKNVLSILKDQNNKVRKMANLYLQNIPCTQSLCEEYFIAYKEFLHHYFFTNEFCFISLEQDIINQFGEIPYKLECMDDNYLQDSDAYKFSMIIDNMKQDYIKTGIINEEVLKNYVDQFAYLYNRKSDIHMFEYIKQNIQSKKDDILFLSPLKMKESSQKDRLIKNYNIIDRLQELRAIRFLMRESMMLFNYNFTQLISKDIEVRYGEYLSNVERIRLVNDMCVDDLLCIDNLDFSYVLNNSTTALFLANDNIYRLDRQNNLSSSNIFTDTCRNKEDISGSVIYGKGILSGKVRKTIISSNQFDDNSIYVTKSLHPKDLFLLNSIKAVIVDEGGILSHASIMAQELKVPCIINARNASINYNDGDEILINFDNGNISLINKLNLPQENCLNKIDKHITDAKLYGNKCVNLSKYVDDFSVADGFVIDSETVKKIYLDNIEGKYDKLSSDDIMNIKSLFPVILRSSSIYEDTSFTTGAGMLESIDSIMSIEQVYSAIIDICESSQTQAFRKYTEMNKLGSGLFPSIMIQKYYKFVVHGTLHILDNKIVLEYIDYSTKECENFTLVNREIFEIINGISDKGWLKFILNNLNLLIQQKHNHLVEFGIQNLECYLLQIRKFGGK